MTEPSAELIELLRSAWKEPQAQSEVSANGQCGIYEDCDTYGFSLVDNSNQATSVIECFKADANWNNPEALTLMRSAYGTDEEQYYSHIATIHPGSDFLSLRTRHNAMIADRCVEEGIKLKNKGSLVESVKKFDEAIKLNYKCFTAFQERGGVKIILGNQFEALSDLERASRLQPDNESAKLEVNALRASLALGPEDRPINKGTNAPQSVGIMRTQGLNRDTISKLQQSLGKRGADRISSDSGSDSSESTESSDNDDHNSKESGKNYAQNGSNSGITTFQSPDKGSFIAKESKRKKKSSRGDDDSGKKKKKSKHHKVRKEHRHSKSHRRDKKKRKSSKDT